MQWSRPAWAALGVVLVAAAPVGAQHDDGDMQIGVRDGALALAFDVTTPVRVAFSDVLGAVTTWTANDPGWSALTSDGALVPIRRGAEVFVELVANDDGRTALKVHDVLLDAPGMRAMLGRAPAGLHHHPEFQLRLHEPPGTFGEGRVAFRLATTSPDYAPSPVYSLQVSNGFLAPVEYATTAYDVAALRCRKALSRARRRVLGGLTPGDDVVRRCGDVDARAVASHLGLVAAALDDVVPCAAPHARTFLRRKVAALDDCLLRIEGMKAREAAGLIVSHALVESHCTHAAGVTGDAATVLGRIARARRRAAAAVRRACGTDAAAILRRVACRADEIASAAYPSAKADLSAFPTRPSQGGASLADHLRCLRGGHAHTHAH